MKRREFIAGLGALVWPPAARAQQRMPTVGLLVSGIQKPNATFVAAFRQGLSQAGFAEPATVSIEYRYAGNDVRRLPELAADLVNERGLIPLAFVNVAEPVEQGFAQSLSQPGRNITGFTNLEASVGSKMLQLLKEIDPQIVRVVVIYNPQTAPFARSYVRPMESAPASLGVETIAMPLQNDSDIEAAMMAAARPGGGLVAIPDTYTSERRDLVVTLARRLRLPAIYGSLSFARSGALMAYAVDARDLNAPCRVLRRSHFKGRQTGGPPGPHADKVWAGHQPTGRQDTRAKTVANLVGHCRRGARMKRREFIAGIGGTVAWTFRARAQQPTPRVIGYLSSSSPEDDASRLLAFHRGLNDAGFTEGQNVVIEYRFGGNDVVRLPALADDLVNRRVAVIATVGGLAPARAAKAASGTIPIVFEVGGDPVQAGLVASLNRPGGNATGDAMLFAELEPKRLELLRELLPRAKRFAAMINPSGANLASRVAELQAAAAAMGARIDVCCAADSTEIDAAFASLQSNGDAVLVTADPLFADRSVQIATLAARYAMPAIYFMREQVVVGGLMSYGPSYSDQARQVGIYVGRILKGEKPACLPVMQPAKFELVINRKTAKALGLEIPLVLWVSADLID
jgi:putative tryptophan/tyrosine transport system substrate-binding protein